MAIFDSFTLGTANNRITFNDYAASPLYRATRRFPTKRELREFDIPLSDELGVADFQTLIGKEYFIIEGKMYPNDESEFHNGRAALRKVASVAVEQADSLSDLGYVPLTWTENVVKFMNVKVLYVDMAESTRQGIIQPFRLLCKIKYPVIYASSVQSGTLTIGTTANPSGGAAIPARIPMQIGSTSSGTTRLPFTLPVVLGGTAGSGSITLNHTGDLYTFPTITINGPISRPKLVNVTTGEYIELDTQLATSGDSAIISYDQDSVSVTANNQNAYGLLTNGSTLFKIKPGSAVFTLSGASTGTGAKATVSFYPAWPLS